MSKIIDIPLKIGTVSVPITPKFEGVAPTYYFLFLTFLNIYRRFKLEDMESLRKITLKIIKEL